MSKIADDEGQKRSFPKLTRELVLSVLPKANGKPIDTMTAHIRIRRRETARFRQINVACMLRRLAVDGFVEKSKEGTLGRVSQEE